MSQVLDPIEQVIADSAARAGLSTLRAQVLCCRLAAEGEEGALETLMRAYRHSISEPVEMRRRRDPGILREPDLERAVREGVREGGRVWASRPEIHDQVPLEKYLRVWVHRNLGQLLLGYRG